MTEYKNFKVMVVDNDSTDSSVEFIKKYFPQVKVMVLDKNYGFVIGNNKGIKYAFKRYTPAYILLLNNDTEIVQKDWLDKMIDVAEIDKKNGIVGCKMLFPDGRIQYGGVTIINNSFRNKYQGEIDNSRYDTIENTFFASGACFLIKKKLIKKIGLLDGIYSPFLGEEMDFFFRARKAGFNIIYCGNTKIIHKGGLSLKKVDDKKRLFISTRNALILAFRYYTISMKILEIFKSMKRNLSTLNIFVKALHTAIISYKNHDKLSQV